MERTLWQQGYGVIQHSQETIERVEGLIAWLQSQPMQGKESSPYALLAAADRLANAGKWLVVHQAYAAKIRLDGCPLTLEEFKRSPQGHVGGSLNMVPAYVGYLLANALMGITRGWVMEQGHAVAAIDSVNVLVNNMTSAHAARYDLSEAGLSRFVQDFYSYRLSIEGKQDSPLGSHVNPHTAGGHVEGGYLGFVSVQYAHMPLPGERLVAFLSDGAFEEQRGGDWVPRWWRLEDSGLIAPIMIANGRRIDQRTTITQEGGPAWLADYLQLHGFDPMIFDGRDPAAFAWAIIEQERRLQEYASYPGRVPYGIAVAPKGAGFYNEGTNHAHNLPLVDNPHENAKAAELFHQHAQRLFVPLKELQEATTLFQQHHLSGRTRERDHPMANRKAALSSVPDLPSKKLSELSSPMEAIDTAFLSIVQANPHLRPRVGNPDEMRSNKMEATLKALKFRALNPEQGAEESVLGSVITALNEEAVAGAAFGNKGGINLIVTYEAFGAKMFGAARQEIIFSKHQKECGKPAGWLSVPIILTSNTWENSKNELSHQDPSLAESMLSETSDISRVIFPADFNSALETIKQLYQTQGKIWSIVVPKQKIPVAFTPEEAARLIAEGGIPITRAGYDGEKASLMLLAIGAYQLVETIKASDRLKAGGIPHRIGYIAEPGRFRIARNKGEVVHLAPALVREALVPSSIRQVMLITHTRPEVMLGTLQPLWEGRTVKALGFINEGGTLGVDDMLYVNRCSWAHIVRESATMLGKGENTVLNNEERAALDGQLSPDGIITKL